MVSVSRNTPSKWAPACIHGNGFNLPEHSLTDHWRVSTLVQVICCFSMSPLEPCDARFFENSAENLKQRSRKNVSIWCSREPIEWLRLVLKRYIDHTSLSTSSPKIHPNCKRVMRMRNEDDEKADGTMFHQVCEPRMQRNAGRSPWFLWSWSRRWKIQSSTCCLVFKTLTGKKFIAALVDVRFVLNWSKLYVPCDALWKFLYRLHSNLPSQAQLTWTCCWLSWDWQIWHDW